MRIQRSFQGIKDIMRDGKCIVFMEHIYEDTCAKADQGSLGKLGPSQRRMRASG